jgi:hypothetical protein
VHRPDLSVRPVQQFQGRAGVTAAFADGFHPFWFWNDRITPERIRAQVGRMHDQGIRGFFIHSRQGLAQPYMSAGFLEMVGVAIDEASSRGMAVHLYDEFPYPSGAAGGAVVQSDPALAGTAIKTTHQRLQGGYARCVLPPGRLLCCVVVPLDGDAADWSAVSDLAADVGMVLTRESYFDAAPQPYNDRRYFADAPAPVLETSLPPGNWELWAVTESVISAHKYWGSFPDVTNAAAVAKFIELTHDRYVAGLGPRLDRVTSMFVDEVEPEISRSVLLELERRWGDEARVLVLAHVAPSHPRHLEALRVFQELRLELFMKTFEAQVASWCRAHHLLYSGEKPSLRLRQLAVMDVPGCEPGHTKAGAARSDLLQADIRGNARATASAAYFYGKEGSLCECFHSLGWGATLQDAKIISESLIAFGTRWLVPHAFFYSTRGLRKYDAPPSFLQMPYWPLFGELTRRVEELARHLDGSVIDASVGIVEPSGGLPDEEQRACYEDLQHRLVEAHCEFVTVDTDILTQGTLSSAGWSYRDLTLQALVVPPMRDPEEELLRFLERFEHHSGFVARVGADRDCEVVVRELTRRFPPAAIVSSRGASAEAVICARRRGPSERWVFLVNTAPRAVALSISSADQLEVVDLGSPPPPLRRAGEGRSEIRLAAFESVLLGSLAGRPRGSGAGEAEPVVLDLATAGGWQLRPLSPNLLRLGRWRMTVGTGPGSSSSSAVVEPAPIVNQLARSSIAFAPLISDRFGLGPEIGLPEMSVRYETSFECSGAADLSIVMQEGALEGRWALRFDGSGPFGPQHFLARPDVLEDCVGIDVSCPERTGLPTRHVHHLTVEALLAPSDGGLRDSIYVAGGFSVFAPSRTSAGPQAVGAPAGAVPLVDVPLLASLGAPCLEGELAAWEANGLPYYAGVVEYARSLPTAGTAEAGGDKVMVQKAEIERGGDLVVEIQLPAGCEEAAEVAFGDGPLRPVPWSPRRVRVPRSELASEPVEVRVRLATALARPFEGRWFDPSSHAYREVDLAAAPGAP